jgi:hypothetical protein
MRFLSHKSSRILREEGSAFCDRLDDALRVLRGLTDYADAPPPRPAAFPHPDVMEAVASLHLPAGALNANDALRLVAAAGVPIVLRRGERSSRRCENRLPGGREGCGEDDRPQE